MLLIPLRGKPALILSHALYEIFFSFCRTMFLFCSNVPVLLERIEYSEFTVEQFHMIYMMNTLFGLYRKLTLKDLS